MDIPLIDSGFLNASKKRLGLAAREIGAHNDQDGELGSPAIRPQADMVLGMRRQILPRHRLNSEDFPFACDLGVLEGEFGGVHAAVYQGGVAAMALLVHC